MKRRQRSNWREFAFMHRQILRAIDPGMTLEEAIENWPRIAYELAEPPRKRKSRVRTLFEGW